MASKSDVESWDLKSWPAAIWPNDGKRARWVLRTHRPELIECGALTRVGKQVVVLSGGYLRFLRRHVGDVIEFRSNLRSQQDRAAA